MLATMEGTAVAMTVASMATRAVDSITPMSTGPRSDRNPTPDDAGSRWMLTAPRLVVLRDHHRGRPAPLQRPRDRHSRAVGEVPVRRRVQDDEVRPRPRAQ